MGGLGFAASWKLAEARSSTRSRFSFRCCQIKRNQNQTLPKMNQNQIKRSTRARPSATPRQNLGKGLPKVNFLFKTVVLKSQVRLQRRDENDPPLPALWRGAVANSGIGVRGRERGSEREREKRGPTRALGCTSTNTLLCWGGVINKRGDQIVSTSTAERGGNNFNLF